MKNFFLWLLVGWLLVFWYFFIKENPDNIYVIKTKNRINKITNKNQELMGIANPASIYCRENNWTLEIKEESEWQKGICTFSDGSSCEERAFFRGECFAWQKTTESPTQKESAQEEPTMCTMEYAPVCAKVQVECIKAPCNPIEQTFGNKCMMEANKRATFFHEGECSSEKKDCPEYMPPSPDFCQNGTIEDQWIDENGCQLPPKCITKE